MSSSSSTVPRVVINTNATGMSFIVNGKTYNLIKYLGGGSFGRVWSAKVGADKRMVKFIKITGDARAREKAMKEVEVGLLLHEDNPDICPAIYDVCQATLDGDEYIMICGQKYTLTLEQYMNEVGRILDPQRAKERGCDILKAFLESWKKINAIGHCNHGDAKPDNFMFLKGKIKWIDLGFVHYQKRGKNIICSSSNSENNHINRDLVQFAVFMYFFKREFLPDDIYEYVEEGILPEMEMESWKGCYAYLNNPANRRFIVKHADAIENFLRNCEEGEFTQIDDSEEEDAGTTTSVSADDALINMLEEELDSDMFTPIPSMPSTPRGLKESLVHETGFYYLEREPSSPTPPPPPGGYLSLYPAALAQLEKAADPVSLRLSEGRSAVPLGSNSASAAAAASIGRIASEVAEVGPPYDGLPYGDLSIPSFGYGEGLSYGIPIPTPPPPRGGQRKRQQRQKQTVQTRRKKKQGKSKKRARATRRR